MSTLNYTHVMVCSCCTTMFTVCHVCVIQLYFIYYVVITCLLSTTGPADGHADASADRWASRHGSVRPQEGEAKRGLALSSASRRCFARFAPLVVLRWHRGQRCGIHRHPDAR